MSSSAFIRLPKGAKLDIWRCLITFPNTEDHDDGFWLWFFEPPNPITFTEIAREAVEALYYGETPYSDFRSSSDFTVPDESTHYLHRNDGILILKMYCDIVTVKGQTE